MIPIRRNACGPNGATCLKSQETPFEWSRTGCPPGPAGTDPRPACRLKLPHGNDGTRGIRVICLNPESTANGPPVCAARDETVTPRRPASYIRDRGPTLPTAAASLQGGPSFLRSGHAAWLPRPRGDGLRPMLTLPTTSPPGRARTGRPRERHQLPRSLRTPARPRAPARSSPCSCQHGPRPDSEEGRAAPPLRRLRESRHPVRPGQTVGPRSGDSGRGQTMAGPRSNVVKPWRDRGQTGSNRGGTAVKRHRLGPGSLQRRVGAQQAPGKLRRRRRAQPEVIQHRLRRGPQAAAAAASRLGRQRLARRDLPGIGGRATRDGGAGAGAARAGGRGAAVAQGLGKVFRHPADGRSMRGPGRRRLQWRRPF